MVWTSSSWSLKNKHSPSFKKKMFEIKKCQIAQTITPQTKYGAGVISPVKNIVISYLHIQHLNLKGYLLNPFWKHPSDSGITGGGRVPPWDFWPGNFCLRIGKKEARKKGKRGENWEEKKENCKREGWKLEMELGKVIKRGEDFLFRLMLLG